MSGAAWVQGGKGRQGGQGTEPSAAINHFWEGFGKTKPGLALNSKPINMERVTKLNPKYGFKTWQKNSKPCLET
jgi:hypothetical protein